MSPGDRLTHPRAVLAAEPVPDVVDRAGVPRHTRRVHDERTAAEPSPSVSSATGLLRAAHPLPAAAVTVLGTALGVAAGLSAPRTLLLAAALLAGQLSIGWANDAVDAARDRLAGRREKPVVAGHVAARTVHRAAVAALLASVPLSLALGPVPGVLHLLAVASAWGYDLWLKTTPVSPLPYVVSFGLLPAVAATAAGVDVPAALVAAAALLGAGAHFANTVPDAAADARTGVRGLPQRLGVRASRAAGAAGVVAACALLVLVPDPDVGTPAAAVLTVAAVVGAAGGLAPGRASFRLVLAAAGIAVGGVLLAGPRLLG